MTTDVEVPVIGKHTFETLTTGMYSDPLDCLREYVQNSVDSIEEGGNLQGGRIDFSIDKAAKSLVIRDNGLGIPRVVATSTLQNIGRSDKPDRASRSRGFRGIGRLGGLAYCERLIFRTQAAGEGIVTSQEWDCKLLRQLLRPDQERDLTMTELITEVSSSSEEPADIRDDGFFVVEMRAVSEPLLLDVRQVKHHLSMVSPVAFDASGFKFSQEVDHYLAHQVPDYVNVNLLVNGEALFKLYTDSPLLSRAPGRKRGSHHDSVKDIDFITLTDSDDRPIAYAWVAMTDLKGLLDPDSGVAGIRLRAGNIGIGDGRALVQGECFPKSDERFAPYLIGEIHAVSAELIPNARRDGFEHGRVRDEFFEACARQIAVPYRRKIREASANRSVQKGVQEAQSIRTEAEEAIGRGLTTEEEREAYKTRLSESQETIRELGPGVQHVIDDLQKTELAMAEAPRMVDVELGGYRKIDRDRFQGLFDILREEASDEDWARRTIKKMIAYLKKAKDCSASPTAKR
jgi:molecular chaperone HtpG